MLTISATVSIPDEELEFRYVSAQGPGGQHVNRAATAAHLRFHFLASKTLPDYVKQRLLTISDQRITGDGAIIIKAQNSRSRLKNTEEALNRLAALIRTVMAPRKKRRATTPSKGSRLRRLESKSKAGKRKELRKKIHGTNDY